MGFIGFGSFSQVRLRNLIDKPEVQVSGFYDNFFEGHSTLPRFASSRELIDSSDAVIVSVPPKFAPQYVCDVLAAGKHVFCEKPAAISIKDLQKVIDTYSGNQILAYGFNHRQHSSVVKISEILEKRMLGDVLWMRGRYGKEVDEDYRYSWRCNPELNGGGILIDQGIHLIDLMNHLSGGFDGAQAVLSNNYLGIDGVDDNSFVTVFSTETKISASLHSTITQWRYLFSLEIFLENGSIILNGLRTNSGNYGNEILTIKPNKHLEEEIETTEEEFTSNDSWRLEMDAFISAINTGKPYPYANLRDAVSVTKLVDLIYEKAIWI